MPGVVERRPHQVVHGGVDDGPAALAGLLDRDHAGEQHAGRRHQPAAGLDHHGHAEALADALDQRAVGLDIGRGLVPVAHAEPAPEVEPRHRVAGFAQTLHQRDEPVEGGFEGRETRELRADVHGEADRLDPLQRGSVRVERRNLRVVDPELVAPPAGGDLVVGLGIHIRVDAQRDRRARACGARGRVEGLKLGRRFDVELPDPGGEREVHLVSRLAGPGEHQAIRRDAGPESAAQLAARDDVGAGAEAGEGADHREGVVGLDRVADERVGRSSSERPVAVDEDPVRVAIGRRAELRRDRGERDPLGVKNAASRSPPDRRMRPRQAPRQAR